MRETACKANCDDQMLTLTRFYSNDIFDSSKQVVSSFNLNLTESKSLIHYLILHTSVIKNY
jgi:hypothetical protein